MPPIAAPGDNDDAIQQVQRRDEEKVIDELNTKGVDVYEFVTDEDSARVLKKIDMW